MKQDTNRLKEWFKESYDKDPSKAADALDRIMNEWQAEGYADQLLDSESIDVDSEWGKLEEKFRQKTDKAPKVIRMWMQYAAAIILLIGTISFLLFPRANADDILVHHDPILLKLNAHNVQNLIPGRSSIIKNNSGKAIANYDGKTLYYNHLNLGESSTVMQHHLEVPPGRTVEVRLLDGTLVRCDSESSLSYYPEVERAGRRQVRLAGNAYFDVAHDDESSFHVWTKDMEIKVLGTKFNVRSHDGDFTKTVLVEGSVVARSLLKEDVVFLEPSQSVTFEPNARKLKVEKVNTYIHTAWQYGELIFNNVEFYKILDQLERKFGVEIVNENIALNSEIFNAQFSHESIKDILEAFQENAGFAYEIEGNQITIR